MQLGEARAVEDERVLTVATTDLAHLEQHAGWPWVRSSLTTRPILTDQTTVTLLMLRRRAERTSEPLRDLQTALVRQARAYLAALEVPAAVPDLTLVTPVSSRGRSL